MKLIFCAMALFFKVLRTLMILAVCAALLFVVYHGNQPMQVPGVPDGMTYFAFMADRFDAAKTVQPARCGPGLIGSLFVLGPFYATLYTHVALNPDSFLAQVTAPNPDLPRTVQAAWYEVPDVWWATFEKLSWTMLAKPHPGCHFRAVNLSATP